MKSVLRLYPELPLSIVEDVGIRYEESTGFWIIDIDGSPTPIEYGDTIIFENNTPVGIEHAG